MLTFKIFIAFIAILISKIAAFNFFFKRSLYQVGITGTVACNYPTQGNHFIVYISEKPNVTKEFRPIAKSSGTFWKKFHLYKIFRQWTRPKQLYIKFFFHCARRHSRCVQMYIKPIPSHMIFRRGGTIKYLNLGSFDVTGKSSLKGTCLRTTKF
uniref:Transthyretin-like family protein n=1 Tax=Strongyloides venezuelensis TaxID=75913 RepID=A0A0K0EVR3_STRVS